MQRETAPWLRLLRLPNLLTVPGDPLAGWLLASGAGAVWSWHVPVAMGIALLLYGAGLIMNDLVDLRVDREERPDRPLPSGRIAPARAGAVALAAILAGLLAAGWLGVPVLLVALVLVVSLSAYNRYLKRTRLGPVAMGLCRGLSLLLGAAVVDAPSPAALAAALGLALYVGAVSMVARHEVSREPPAFLFWAPAVAVLANLFLLLKFSAVGPDMAGRLGIVLFLAFAMSGQGAWHLHARGWRAAPVVVGLWLSALLILQAAYCAASNAGPLALGAGLLLLVLWPLNRLLARRIAAS